MVKKKEDFYSHNVPLFLAVTAEGEMTVKVKFAMCKFELVQKKEKIN